MYDEKSFALSLAYRVFNMHIQEVEGYSLPPLDVIVKELYVLYPDDPDLHYMMRALEIGH